MDFGTWAPVEFYYSCTIHNISQGDAGKSRAQGQICLPEQWNKEQWLGAQLNKQRQKMCRQKDSILAADECPISRISKIGDDTHFLCNAIDHVTELLIIDRYD